MSDLRIENSRQKRNVSIISNNLKPLNFEKNQKTPTHLPVHTSIPDV